MAFKYLARTVSLNLGVNSCCCDLPGTRYELSALSTVVDNTAVETIANRRVRSNRQRKEQYLFSMSLFLFPEPLFLHLPGTSTEPIVGVSQKMGWYVQ